MSNKDADCLILHQSESPSEELKQLQLALLRNSIDIDLKCIKGTDSDNTIRIDHPTLIILWQHEFSLEAVNYILDRYFSESTELHRLICLVESQPLSARDHLDLAKKGVAVIHPVNSESLNIDEITASLIASLRSFQCWREALERDRQESRRLMLNIMRQNSEIGLVSQFLHECNSHQSIEKIAFEFVSILNQLGLETVCEIRMRSRNVITATAGRKPTLTEMQILQAARHKDRLITCHRLAVVNYQNITILIKNMPIYDEDRYGHCKDIIVQLGDVAQTRVHSLSVETAANERAAIIELVQQKSSDNIRHMHIIMKRLLVDAETSLSFLGCTEEQERVIVDLIENARSQLDALHDSNALLEDHLAGVMLSFSDPEMTAHDRQLN
ncbi:MAG TPA: hypothetical protein VFM46_02320 [Pseudomonadales bacterium]|nr:hypothetical protein [Pseudomonadales bacterium]